MSLVDVYNISKNRIIPFSKGNVLSKGGVGGTLMVPSS